MSFAGGILSTQCPPLWDNPLQRATSPSLAFLYSCKTLLNMVSILLRVLSATRRHRRSPQLLRHLLLSIPLLHFVFCLICCYLLLLFHCVEFPNSQSQDGNWSLWYRRAANTRGGDSCSGMPYYLWYRRAVDTTTSFFFQRSLFSTYHSHSF